MTATAAALKQTNTPSQPDIDFYHERGYLPWRKVLDDRELDILRHEYDRIFELGTSSGECRDLSTGEQRQSHAPSAKPMLQIMQLCERSLIFRKLLYHGPILDVFRSIIGPNFMLFHDQALFKPAHHGGPVPWHQDNAYWQCRPANLMSCWLTLDDVTAENGAMHFVSGSHLRPVWHGPRTDTTALVDAAGQQLDTSGSVVVPLPAGACLFHHCQTLHYTQPNTTGRQRRAFIIHVMLPGTRDRDGQAMRASFARPVLSQET
ncbi:MAG: phytanoyl-CoA dioxygenase family protein [Planctomycetota bacterium]